MYFLKRIPEPKEMGDIEFEVFESESKKSYKRWMIPLVDDALKVSKLQTGKILDVACGPGLLTKEFARRSKKFNVIGVDFSPIAIKMAKRNCKNLNNIIFKIADASNLPFEESSFDLIVCKDSIHHFNNLDKVLLEMYRVLKHGGILYLQDLRRDLPMYLLKSSIPPKSTFQKLQYYSTRAAYTKRELSKIIKFLFNAQYGIKTRKITADIDKKYRKLGIDINKLRASFQSRYVVIVKK